MKKLTTLLVFVLLLASSALYGQTNPKFLYCEIGVTENYSRITKQSLVKVDFGSKELTTAIGNTMLDPQTGKFMAFRSPVDALNYLGRTGWELLQTYTSPAISKDDLYIHYILRKPFDEFSEEVKAAAGK